MKQLIFFLFFIFSVVSIKAQNYTVGEPINELISTTTYYSHGTCSYPHPDVFLSFPKSTVSGVNHVLIISSIESENPVHLLTGDTLHTGDTLIFTESFNDYQLISSGIWQISFTAKSVGIPQIPDQLYNCGEGLWFDGLSECDNFLTFQFDNNLCEVVDSLAIQSDDISPLMNEGISTNEILNTASLENIQLDLQYYLNPDNELLTIINSNDIVLNEIAIIDATGKTQNLNFEQSSKITLDLTSIPNGVYIIEIITDKNSFRRKIIKGN